MKPYFETTLAKDIPFVKRKRAISPLEYENKLLGICQEKNWTYHGFILPWKTPSQNTLVCIESNGNFYKPYMWQVLSGAFTGKPRQNPPKKKPQFTEEEHLKIAQEFFDKHGWDVLGCSDQYTGVDTRLILRCRCHGRIIKTSDLHNARRRGGLICPEIRHGLSEMLQGGATLGRLKKIKNRPMFIYIMSVEDSHIKYGVTLKNDVRLRLNEHKRVNHLDMDILYTYQFKKAWQAADVEYGIQCHVKGKRISRKIMPSGFSETLPKEKYNEVKQFIEDYIKTNPTKPLYLDKKHCIEFDFGDVSDEELDIHFDNLANVPCVELTEDDMPDLSPLEAL